MNHPTSRAHRRHNGDVWRNRQRFKMLATWYRGIVRKFEDGQESAADYWTDNNMWWARKQSSAHGNRCYCHYEKYSPKAIRERRQGLDVKANRKSLRLSSLQEEDETYWDEILG